jgi:hypothetical protein
MIGRILRWIWHNLVVAQTVGEAPARPHNAPAEYDLSSPDAAHSARKLTDSEICAIHLPAQTRTAPGTEEDRYGLPPVHRERPVGPTFPDAPDRSLVPWWFGSTNARRSPPEAAADGPRALEAALVGADPGSALDIARRILAMWQPPRGPRPLETAKSKRQPSSAAHLAARVREAACTGEFAALERDLRTMLCDAATTGQAPDPAWLDELASALPKMPLRQAIVAARLLACRPNPAWGQALKLLWLHLTPLCRCAETSSGAFTVPQVWNPLRAIADQGAFAVAEALAGCVLAEGGRVDFAADRRKWQPVQALEQQLKPLADRHRAAADRYHQLIEQHASAADREFLLASHSLNELAELETHVHGPVRQGLHSLRNDIRELEAQMAALETARSRLAASIQPQLSAPWLLYQALATAQRHAPAVVQAAAGALAKLLERGRLAPQAAEEVRACLTGVFKNDAAGLRERLVRLLPDSNAQELALALQDGLAWMLAMEPYLSPAPAAAAPPACAGEMPPRAYPRVREIADLLCARLPEVARFLETYPLRLMGLRTHDTAFGVYRTSGAVVELWYEYNRPQEEGGVVNSRFLRLNDRVKPNAIGLDYRLLSHPLLAIPVLYHEYLHYGGTSGREQDGIRNEMEVLLREITFAKALLADLAPRADSDLAAFEAEILAACDRADDAIGLVFQWLEDPFDAATFDLLNREIPRLYTSRADPSGDVAREIVHICDANNRITWCGWIRWPVLGRPETEGFTQEFLHVRRRHAEAQHFLSPEERRQILREKEVAGQRGRWASYTLRPGSLDTLRRARSERSASHQWSGEEVGRLMAVRFLGLLESCNLAETERSLLFRQFLSSFGLPEG